MKKNNYSLIPMIKSLWGTKLLRIMRVTLCVMVLSITQVFAKNTYSQVTSLSLNFKNAAIKNILEQIENQTDYYFIYDATVVNVDRKVNLQSKNQLISEILDEIFKDTDVIYKINNRQIALSVSSLNNRSQQPTSVSGKVIDISGALLPGVTVVVKGTTSGAITDVNGNFILANIPGDATLVFSFVGMKTQEVPITGKSVINVTLEEDAIGIEEVVAIGYGLQKKVNLTGSVASVSAAELEKRTVANPQNILEGRLPGLQIVQSSGQPGKDGATMRIRGEGTYSSAGSDPLVLVDGVQGDLSILDTDNIESVTVLKDAASCAIYGARAANGVILVTTKRGKSGSLSIDYHANYQIQMPTRTPDLVTNSADFMEYWNMAAERSGVVPPFTQDEINAFRNSNDPVKYPNFDWVDYMINPAPATKHNLTASGGTEKTTYQLSFGYLYQDGVVGDIFNFNKYNFQANINSKLNDVVSIGAIIGMSKRDVNDSNYPDHNFILLAYGGGPNYTPYLSDGSGRFSARYNNAAWHNRNPKAVEASGSQVYNYYRVTAQSYIDINIMEGLVLHTKGAVDFGYDFSKLHEHPVDNYYFSDNSYAHNNNVWHLGVTDQMNQKMLTTFYSTLNYNKKFEGDHHLNILAGYNQEDYGSRYLKGSRKEFPTDFLKELDAASTNQQSTGGDYSDWAIQSFFGRVNYDFKEKYLFEANLRYDGTSRMYKDYRWGAFPSLSAGWRISEEGFLKNTEWIDNLKIRISWGELGNQNIGTYPYQDVMSLTSYVFNSVVQGARVNDLTDKALHWETTTVKNLGADFTLWSGLLSLSTDWYHKYTDGILYTAEIPLSIGLGAPVTNYGEMKNTGIELDLRHQNKIGELKYSFSFNLTKNKNEVTKFKAPSYTDFRTTQEGLPINSWYMYDWIGIFQTQEEIDNAPLHPATPKPGDLRFKDQNNDGKIDGDDRIVYDGAHPDFFYGADINFEWKNFDMSVFFQGVQGKKEYLYVWLADPLVQGTPPLKDYVKNMWTPTNPSNTTPGIYLWGYNPNMGSVSDYHLYDASYLRLKNITIGYQVPQTLCKKIGLKAARLYVSGDNVLTFTNFPTYADPERTGGELASVQPQISIYTIGAKLKF